MTRNLLAAGLVALAAAATAFEGGGSPDGILLVHGLLVTVVGLALLVPRQEAAGLAPVPAAGLAAFSAALLASAWQAPYGFAALLVVQDVAVGLAVVLLAAREREAAGAPPVRLALLAVASLQGALALGQWIAGSPRAAGSFLNPNHLGAWVAAVLLGALPPLLGAQGSIRTMALTLALPAVGALLATRSRGAVVGALTGLAVLLLLRWKGLSSRARGTALAGATVAALLALALLVSRSKEDDPYRWTRTRIWAASLSISAGAPWLGCGPGQFPAAAAGARFQDPVGPLHWERRFTTPHSDVLRLPAEFGLPAALAALAFLVAGLPGAVRRARASDGLAQASSLAGLTALFAQGAVDDLTSRPALVVLAALLLGPLWAREREPAGALPPGVRLALAGGLAVALLAGDVAPWLAWRTLAGIPRAEVSGGTLERALTWNPVHPDLHLRAAERIVRRGLRSPDDYARARAEAETAVRLSPREAGYRVGLARVEAAACRSLFPDEATRARAAAHYGEAVARSPRDASILLEEATFLLATGDTMGGERAARSALALEPEAVRPRLVLARALAARGEPAVTLLREAEERLARYAPVPKNSPYARLMLSAAPGELDALRAVVR